MIETEYARVRGISADRAKRFGEPLAPARFVRHMSVTAAMQGLTAAHHDTQRDNSKAAREPGYAEACRLDPVIDPFEALATRDVTLSSRSAVSFDGLIHPVHQRGRAFGWEVLPR